MFQREIRVWIMVIVFICIAISIGACSQDSTVSQPTATPTPSVASQLATIDTQNTPDAATVAKYQTLLTSLHDKTGDSEQTISDETVKAQQLLQEKGKSPTLLDLMHGVDTSITKSEHMHYADAIAALITILENQ